jgi:hypothetical protein
MTQNKKGNKSGSSNDASDLINHQKAIDDAVNERLKSEEGSDKIDPKISGNKKRRAGKSDVARKKTGGGQQNNPGM